MKKNITQRFFTLTLLLALYGTMVATNRLSLPDVWGAQGTTIELPVYMETQQDIVAVQLTLTMPTGTTIDQNRIMRTNRLSDHSVAVSRIASDRYLLTVMSATNSVIVKGSGELLTLLVNVGNGLTDGTVYNISMSDAVMSLRSGQNIIDEAIGSTLTVDAMAPKLTLRASKTDVTEGETFQLTVATAHPVRHASTVHFACEEASRFSLPPTAVIATGQTTATVEVTAVENDEIEGTKSVAFYATMEGYDDGECMQLLYDDDLPELTFRLTPNTVSEAAGTLIGTISRSDRLNSRVTLRLGDDSQGQLSYGSRSVTLPKGQREVQFSIGINDNLNADGDRQVTVSAVLFSQQCNCSLTGEGIDTLRQTLTIIDNEGPTLTLHPENNTLFEGGTAGRIIVSHNTPLAGDVVVNFNSDHDDLLNEYPHQLTIPAGQTQAVLTVSAKTNDTEDDSQMVTLTARAEGYAIATCWQMVTDQTMPDATISLHCEKQTVEAGQTLPLILLVSNRGTGTLSSATLISLKYSTSAQTMSVVLPQAVLPGDSVLVNYNVFIPTTTGQQYFQATVNEGGRVKELITANNTSEKLFIDVVPPFTAKAHALQRNYAQDEAISIVGTTTGSDGKDADVEVYLLWNGIRHSMTTHSDANGSFTAQWTPPTGMAGRFMLGACFPGSGSTEAQDSTGVWGLQQTRGYTTCELGEGETMAGTIVVKNPANTMQTGIGVDLLAEATGCSFMFDAPKTIAAGKEAAITFTATGTAVTAGRDWLRMPVAITTAEGARTEHLIYYYVSPQQAHLETATPVIETTMTLTAPRDYPIVIRNTGRGATGIITLNLPGGGLVQTLTPQTMASLGYGDSTTILLHFMPTSEMRLNVPVTATIGINCEQGSGTAVTFHITPVSNSRGTIAVDVVDEFTFNTAEKPHVEGATVRIENAGVGTMAAEGLTDADGIFSAKLPAGYYNLTVSADRHSSFTTAVFIDPSREKVEEVFLPYQAVTYGFDVVETEVGDVYTITTTAEYETQVPKPVVTITIPDSLKQTGIQPGSIVPIDITNHGLVKADDVEIDVNSGDCFIPEFLSGSHLDSLPAHSTYTVYVKMQSGSSSTCECIRITVRESHRYACDKYKNLKDYSFEYYQYGLCASTAGGSNGVTITGEDTGNIISGTAMGGIGPGAPGGGGGGGGYYGGSSSYGSVASISKVCDSRNDNDNFMRYDPSKDPNWNDCKDAVFSGIGQCFFDELVGIIPFVGCVIGIGKDCFLPYTEGKLTGWKSVGCAATVIGCIPGIGQLDEIASIIGCAATIADEYSSCKNNDGSRIRADNEEMLKDIVDDFFDKYAVANAETRAALDYFTEIFGDEEWLHTNSLELANLLDWLRSHNPEELIAFDENLLQQKPTNISEEKMRQFVERYNNTTSGNATNYEGMSNYIHADTLLHYANIIDELEEYAVSEGYVGTQQMLQTAFAAFMDYWESIKIDSGNDQQTGICSTVTLVFPQEMVLTRQAFRGTLTVSNGHEAEALRDLKVYIEVRDSLQRLATTHEMQISMKSIEGFGGDLSLDAGWTLQGGATGRATIEFIPTRFAATTGPAAYSFGGSFTYTDPFTGLTVTRQLTPVTLTVSPSPVLDLDYFMQRDIYGDDPLTEDVVEPMVPAEFALIINNKGAGEARNVRMTTRQPQIVDNEKGLAVEFSIISSSLNGLPENMLFSDSYATDFGTIAPQSQSYAQWWLTSTLLGHFTKYDVTVNHITSYGNPDMNLIEQTTIHELIHGFSVAPDGHGLTRRGFLVNDIVDADDQPDRVYFTDATQDDVHIGAGSVSKLGDNTYLLSITPSLAGWNYGSVADPTGGTLVVAEVTRLSDGAELPADNVWQTNRTLRDGRDWLYENRLHWVALLPEGGESYLLTFHTNEELGIDEIASDDEGQQQLRLTLSGGWLTIMTKGHSDLLRVELFDLRGMKRLDAHHVKAGQALYVGQLPAGIYQVVVTTDSGIQMAKVLKRN